MASISGCWKFNDIITVQIMREEVTFYSYNGYAGKYQTFDGFYAIGNDFLNYIAEGYGNIGETWVFRSSTKTWRADKCRRVDFGPDPQTVSEEFYTWFIANAKRKQFTKLNIGDVVATSGGKCFKRLSTE